MGVIYNHSAAAKSKPVETKSIIKKLRRRVKDKKAPLGIFLVAPHEEDFDVKEEEETIVLFLRHHWFTTIKWFIVTLIFLFLPAVIKPLLPVEFFVYDGKLVNGAILFWYLFTLTYFIRNFLDWYYDVYFITDERVVDINFRNMLSRQISDTRIERIQDISLSQQGFFESLFNYGDVLVQTAAEKSLFKFRSIPNPRDVLEVLQDLIAQEEEENYKRRVEGVGNAP